MLVTIMLDAYLGIASPAGLHSLVADHAHTRLFLSRRLRRLHSRPVCGLWIVLPRDVAGEVLELLAIGERIEALKVLEQNARDLGTLIPDSIQESAEF